MTSALAFRAEAVAELVQRLKARPEIANVTVSTDWPGDEMGDQALWVGDIDGELEYPSMRAGTQDIDDVWKITLEAQVVSDDVGFAWLRAGEIVGEVEMVCREDPTLGFTGITFVAEIASSQSTAVEVLGGGARAFAQVVVSCNTHIRSEP